MEAGSIYFMVYIVSAFRLLCIFATAQSFFFFFFFLLLHALLLMTETLR